MLGIPEKGNIIKHMNIWHRSDLERRGTKGGIENEREKERSIFKGILDENVKILKGI